MNLEVLVSQIRELECWQIQTSRVDREDGSVPRAFSVHRSAIDTATLFEVGHVDVASHAERVVAAEDARTNLTGSVVPAPEGGSGTGRQKRREGWFKSLALSAGATRFG